MKPSAKEATTEKTDRGERGVMRLLQEGHFRGVADVRLRMNFSEELERLTADSAAAAEELPPGAIDDAPPSRSSLPPLEAPDNKGRAYQKFLDAYLGTSAADEATVPESEPVPPQESLDLVA